MADQNELDTIANLWNKTKDPKYKELWYKKIKENTNGTNNFKRRTVSINSCVKANDGTYTFVGTFSDGLHGPVRTTSFEIDGVRRFPKLTHNE